MAPPKHPRTERNVYTDAAGQSQIIAAVCITSETFAYSDTIASVRASETGTNGEKPSKRPATYMDMMS